MAVRKLGDVAVGTIAKIKIDGSFKNLVILHQGNPDPILYDASCDGTWVCLEDIYDKMAWYNNTNNYPFSIIHSWMNNDFIQLLEPDIQDSIKQVKIPYVSSGYMGQTVMSGSRGLSCKIFALSLCETGIAASSQEYIPKDGAKLDYFLSGISFEADKKRIAKYNGAANAWHTRSAETDGQYHVWTIDETGGYYSGYGDDTYGTYGVRPAFILPQSLYMLDDGTIITNQSPTAPASITASNVMGGQQATVTLGAASDPDGTVINYVYERSIDTGMWTQFASTASLSIIDQISDDWDTVRYRAKAVDDKGAEGPYATSQTYTVIHNQPPTAPASITASNVMGGQEAAVTLGAATDTDGQIINYTYERQVDGISWTQFASENSLTVTDSIDDSWTTVAYRARAMDDMGAEGPYAASEVYTVVHNLPPTAPGSIQVTNVTTGQEAAVTLTAATDPDGTVASYIYERSVDGAEFQPFANVNSLTQTDHISGDWGTVAYRACAVDDDGAAGPYVTSETKTVTTGLVTIAGPAADLGEKPMPFAFWFSCGVSDQTAVQDIAVRVTVDGKDFFTGTLDSGAAKGLYIDTRFRGAGQHTIAVTASKEDYQPAAASYTFTVPSVTLPYEGRAEMPQNSAGQPVWWYGLARFIFGEDGKDLITLMQEMQAASLKMVTGSYQGTGQSGSSNPNILAAAFTPKAVMLSSGSDAVLLAIPEEGDTGTTDGISYTKASTGVSWFAGDAAAQYNESGKTYRYVMFG